MKFREYKEFAEAISEALQNFMDDEWDSGRLSKNQTSHLSTLEKGTVEKAGKLHGSVRLLFISRKTLEYNSKQNTASISRRDDE